MSTPKQAAASRANALKSTGPRTTEGRAASRYNALKHGIHAQKEIMFDETAEDLAELSAEYHEHHAPADTDERLLVDTLIHNEWRLRRMRRVEAVLWEHANIRKPKPAIRPTPSSPTPATSSASNGWSTAARATITAPSKRSNASKQKWGRRFRLPTPVPCRRERLPIPRNPNPLLRNWVRSVKIRKDRHSPARYPSNLSREPRGNQRKETIDPAFQAIFKKSSTD
jgi:hypothetical protein